MPIGEHRDGGGQISLAVFRCRKPMIAAINGYAVGVGITMTLRMGNRIVSEDAKTGFVLPCHKEMGNRHPFQVHHQVYHQVYQGMCT